MTSISVHEYLEYNPKDKIGYFSNKTVHVCLKLFSKNSWKTSYISSSMSIDDYFLKTKLNFFIAFL